MALHMGCEAIKNGVHLRIIIQIRTLPTKPLNPRAALAIIREQAVNIGAEDPAIGRNCAIGMAIDAGKRQVARRTRGFANMHFIAG